MTHVGKILVLVGLILVALGAAIWLLGRMGFRGLPGDINYDSGNVRFYFPVVTCLLLSVVLTLAMWIWRWLGRS